MQREKSQFPRKTPTYKAVSEPIKAMIRPPIIIPRLPICAAQIPGVEFNP
jgi:hypothetical protein